MRRRAFIRLLSTATATWPLAVRAQQSGKIVRIGFFGISLDTYGMPESYKIFLDELRAGGFSEGQDLIVEYRALDDPRGISAVGTELAHLQLNVIVVQGPEAALKAVVDAGGTTPIVVQAINFDPMERGYIASLARPGGYVTGLFYRQADLAAKKVELLAEAFPDRRRLGVLWDALVTDELRAAEHAAQSLQLEFHALKLEDPPYDFPGAFRAVARGGAQMLLILSSPWFSRYREQLAEQAIAYRLPTMFIFKSYVQAGGLMSYGVDQTAMYRRTAALVVKILKGARPAELPVEQAAKFELVINLRTAKAIGVTIPQFVLTQADEVIE